MHREHLVVLVGTENTTVGQCELQTNEKSFNTANDEEQHGDCAVHDADLLMVDSDEPFFPTSGCYWTLESAKTLRRRYNKSWCQFSSGSFDNRHDVLRLLQRQ